MLSSSWIVSPVCWGRLLGLLPRACHTLVGSWGRLLGLGPRACHAPTVNVPNRANLVQPGVYPSSPGSILRMLGTLAWPRAKGVPCTRRRIRGTTVMASLQSEASATLVGEHPGDHHLPRGKTSCNEVVHFDVFHLFRVPHRWITQRRQDDRLHLGVAGQRVLRGL
jgi:hypothetical protein